MVISTVSAPLENLSETVRLPDGRVLGFAEYGVSGGRPIFYFHGGNSSRLEGRWLAAAAYTAGIHLIAPDRPGFGLSDPDPARTIVSWSNDVAHLADVLELPQFGVLGLSGGGPHAAAVAHELPQRMLAAGIVSGVAPPEMPGWLQGVFLPLRLNFLAARHAPRLSRLFLEKMSTAYANPDNFLKMVQRGMPEPDRELARHRPEAIYQFSAAAVESHRQGSAGDIAEWQLYVRPWGFELEHIDVPVELWYGAVDNFVPPAMGGYLAQRIPHSHLHIVPDGGHFSTMLNYADDILSALGGV